MRVSGFCEWKRSERLGGIITYCKRLASDKEGGKQECTVSLSQNCPVTELFKGPHKQLHNVLNLEGPLVQG